VLSIPMHSGDLKTGTLRKLITAAGLSIEEFIEALEGR